MGFGRTKNNGTMKIAILSIFLFTTSTLAKATVDCIWTVHKAGITIRYIASCNFENQSMPDSILKIVVNELNRQDTSLKVLVVVNDMRLSFPKSAFSNFFSIAIDTLREIDDDYIFNFYWNQVSISTGKNGGLNTFRSQDVPLDINATNNKKARKTVGIKIIYSIDYRLGEPNWNDVIKAIVYASKNLAYIKNNQKRDTVRYNTNGWYVSLVTIDTTTINQIIGRRFEYGKKIEILEPARPNDDYWLFGFLGLTIIGLAIYFVTRIWV